MSADTAAQVGAGAAVKYTARHLELLTLMAALKWVKQSPVTIFEIYIKVVGKIVRKG